MGNHQHWERLHLPALPARRWSGGETRQIAIYPDASAFERRDFAWRISEASIETPQSLFTALPGYRRTLLLLEGKLMLEHEGRRWTELSPLMQDSFDGDWTTRSTGVAKDLNLIYDPRYSVDLHVHALAGNNALRLSQPKVRCEYFRAFYGIAGQTAVRFQSETFELRTGELTVYRVDGARTSAALTAQAASSMIAEMTLFGQPAESKVS